MTSLKVYKELDGSKYHRFQRDLLKDKGSTTQRQFLEALKDNADFVAFIENEVEIIEGQTLPTFNGPLTESSFKEPTEDQESLMYDLWRDTPANTACRVSFWAGATLEHIRLGTSLQASWLAGNGGITETGEERIDHSLTLTGDAGSKAVDDCIRTAFRRMSGLPFSRGNRTVFVNPIFGRGWWRGKIISRILQRPDEVEERPYLLDVVRRNQQYWENLVTMIVSRGSVFGSIDVQDALINSLAKHLRQYPETSLRSASTLNTALRRLSNIAASLEMGTMEFDEISALVDPLLERISGTTTPETLE